MIQPAAAMVAAMAAANPHRTRIMIRPNLLQRILARGIIAERDRLAKALTDILQFSAAINQELDDPHADGSGDDSQSPDGDSFNALDAEVCTLAHEALADVRHP